jgi:manganese/zinc/iron transport system permease protein
MPDPADILNILLLRDYNTRIVVVGASLLGVAAGIVGTFLLLRRRSLMGDALSHATLPGVGLAFLVMVELGGTGKALGGLLIGAAATGLLGVLAVLVLRAQPRIRDDAAMGIVLSVFFGAGVALLGVAGRRPGGSAAGLESFINGTAASMIREDVALIFITLGTVVALAILLRKEFCLLCFDESFAASLGWRVRALDLLMLALVTAVTVVGLQAVGLILIIALLIIPPAAARFWTERLNVMLPLAGAFGAASGWIGASASAAAEHLPTGAAIVLAASAIFVVSMLFGRFRGAAIVALRRLALSRRVAAQHLLRAIYEQTEPHATAPGDRGATIAELLEARTWSGAELRRAIRRAERAGLVRRSGEHIALTDAGRDAAARVVRNHRLWELYLVHHADIAPSHVDRDADQIEHILPHDLIERLESLLDPASGAMAMPRSPHAIAMPASASGAVRSRATGARQGGGAA